MLSLLVLWKGTSCAPSLDQTASLPCFLQHFHGVRQHRRGQITVPPRQSTCGTELLTQCFSKGDFWAGEDITWEPTRNVYCRPNLDLLNKKLKMEASTCLKCENQGSLRTLLALFAFYRTYSLYPKNTEIKATLPLDTDEPSLCCTSHGFESKHPGVL